MKKTSKLLNNTLMKKLALGLSLSFSLFSLLAASLAWFWTNHTVKGHSTTMPDKYDLNCEFELFKYDPSAMIGTDVDDNGKKFDILDGSFTFIPYDSIFKSRNWLTPVVVRITVTGTVITSVNTGTLTLDISRDVAKAIQTQNLETGEYELAPYFTSAMNFKFAVGNSNIAYKDSNNQPLGPSGIMDSAVAYFTGSSAPTAQSFTSGNITDGWEKEASLSFRADFTSSDFIGTTDPILYAYLFIDYDLSLVTNFSQVSFNEGGNIGDIFSSGTTTELTNDLDTISVGFETSDI